MMQLNSISIPDDVANIPSGGKSNVSPNEAETVAQVDTPSPTNPTIALSPQPELASKKADETDNVNSPDNVEGENVSSENLEDISEELEKYRKMLKFGVHESAVRQKMLIEGIEPARLNL